MQIDLRTLELVLAVLMKRIHAVETVGRTHWSHDRTWSIRIYGDAIFTELHSWKA